MSDAIIRNAMIHFARLDPKHPDDSFDKENPTWSIEIRTTSPEQKDEWMAQDLSVKLVKYKEGHEKEGEAELSEDGKKQWRVRLKRKSINKKGDPSSPVTVVNGKNKPIDAASVGRGSIANIKVFQSEYTLKGKEGISSTLMAVQVTKHKVYVPQPREDFEETDYERIEPEGEEADDMEDDDETSSESSKPSSPQSPKAPNIKKAADETDDF